MKEWSKDWISSKKPNKQRKYRYNAPLHIKQSFMSVHLSPELRKKYTMRSINLRKGDKVKVLRGQYSKKEGKVSRISLIYGKVFVEGVETIKRDGSKSQYALQPSNLMITELIIDDKRRKNKLGKEEKKESKQ